MNRKLFAIIMSVTLLTMSGLRAQETSIRPVNDVYFEYGQGSMVQFASVLSAALAETFTAGLADIDKVRSTGSFTVGYTHSVTKWLWLGGELCYENCALISYNEDGSKDTGNLNALNLMGACKMNWFDRQHFAMYSKLCAGLAVVPAKEDTSLGFAFQVSPVCFESGGMKLRGFMEAGWGLQSMIAVGIRYRF